MYLADPFVGENTSKSLVSLFELIVSGLRKIYLVIDFKVHLSKHDIKYSFSWLLVALYATIYVGWDMVHVQVHQEEAISHSAQVEKDSCHRSIFHGEQDAHKSHVAAFKNCASCHVVAPSPLIADVLVSLPKHFVASEFTTIVAFRATLQVSFLFSSREPP